MSHADSVYQQLRAHLAYLKLTAAAEALPAQLDQARTTKMGHTEFLEALLRTEVQATEQRRWEGRMRSSLRTARPAVVPSPRSPIPLTTCAHSP